MTGMVETGEIINIDTKDVEKYKPYIVYIIKKNFNMYKSEYFDDMVQEGYCSILRTIQRLNGKEYTNNGVCLEDYVNTSIRLYLVQDLNKFISACVGSGYNINIGKYKMFKKVAREYGNPNRWGTEDINEIMNKYEFDKYDVQDLKVWYLSNYKNNTDDNDEDILCSVMDTRDDYNEKVIIKDMLLEIKSICRGNEYMAIVYGLMGYNKDEISKKLGVSRQVLHKYYKNIKVKCGEIYKSLKE